MMNCSPLILFCCTFCDIFSVTLLFNTASDYKQNPSLEVIVYPACITSTHKTAENNRTIRVVALVEPDSPFPPKEIRPSNIAHVGLCFVKYLKSMSASKVSEIEKRNKLS